MLVTEATPKDIAQAIASHPKRKAESTVSVCEGCVGAALADIAFSSTSSHLILMAIILSTPITPKIGLNGDSCTVKFGEGEAIEYFVITQSLIPEQTNSNLFS